MEDPTSSPLNPESKLQIEQNVDGDGSQLFGNITGHHITIATINNYHYQEQLRSSIDDANKSVEADLPCPYRGLFHFGPRDAEYFFGRETFVEELVRATQTSSFIPLLGASGSGKSSVVLAGLVPKLQQAGHWQFTHFRPGADPFHALALALVPLYTTNLDETEQLRQSRNLAGYFRTGEVLLADVFAQIQQNYPTNRVLLIADQFEELYTLCTDEATRRNFLDKLLAGIAAPTDRSPFAPVLVATMRADFLGNALSYRPFADVLQNADLKLGPMNRSELKEVIEKPAQKLGVTFEAGLVPRILDAVNEEPGNLPLLEFALRELWQRRSGKQLTHAAYEAIGEVQGALTRHADEAIDKISKLYADAGIIEVQKMQGDLDPQACHKLKEELRQEQREQIQRIFVQLVRPGEGAEDTRRVAMKAELGEQSWSLVRQLADENNRLVVTSQNGAEQETVEIVHEALIRQWGDLRGWMETDRVFRAWQERLRGAMRQWQETKQDEGSLLRGAALVEAEEQLRKRPEELVSESDFIEQSLQDRERIQQAEATHRKREIRIARGIVGGSLVAVAVSSGFGWMAWQQTRQAELNLADFLSVYASSLVDQGKDLDALISAIKAGKILQNQHRVKTSMLNTLQKVFNQRSEYNRLEGHGDYVYSVSFSFSRDGKTLASGSGDNTIKLWNVDTGNEITKMSMRHSKSVLSVSFSRDGKTLASGSEDNTIKLWDVDTGKEITKMSMGHSKSVLSVSFSRDGKTLASGSEDNTIKLWDVKTENEIPTKMSHSKSVHSVSFSPDGKTLASGSEDSTIKLWNVKTGNEIPTKMKMRHGNFVLSVSFSPDGKTLASGSKDNTIKLWNVKTGNEIPTKMGHDGYVHSVSFSPDGQTLASGSGDNKIKLWDVKTGNEIPTKMGHDDYVYGVRFNPNKSALLATSGNDKKIKLWNVEKRNKFLYKHGDKIYSVRFSPDGQTLASGSVDNTIKLWDLKAKRLNWTLTGHSENVYSISFSPDNKILATGSGDNTIKLWNVKTGKEIYTKMRMGHNDKVLSVSFSPDGKTLASGSKDKTIKLWNVKTGQLKKTLKKHDSHVYSVSFSPDGQTLASGSWDNTIKLWNVNTETEIPTKMRHGINPCKEPFEECMAKVYSVSFSHDGKTLASGSLDKTIKLWNVKTGEEIRTFLGHKNAVLSVSFSHDDRTLASGSWDKTIKLWDIGTGQEIVTDMSHDQPIWGVSFNHNSKSLASGSEDKIIKLWTLSTPMDLSSLMGSSCDWVSHYLLNNINVSESDKHLCDGMDNKKQ
jgi:WD40 repeat protein